VGELRGSERDIEATIVWKSKGKPQWAPWTPILKQSSGTFINHINHINMNMFSTFSGVLE